MVDVWGHVKISTIFLCPFPFPAPSPLTGLNVLSGIQHHNEINEEIQAQHCVFVVIVVATTRQQQQTTPTAKQKAQQIS